MSMYGSDDITIEFDNDSDSLTDMSTYVTDIGGLTKEAILEEIHTFGDAWVEQGATDLKRGNEVTIGGFYDDTASTGPDAIFNAIGDTRTLKITWGGSKTTSWEVIIRTYTRTPSRGAFTRFECAVMPTGSPTEA